MKMMRPLILLALLPSLSMAPAWSQPPGRGDGPPGGPRGFGGGMRNSPKNRISRFMRGLERMEEESKTPLNKAQARKIVSLVSPWRSRKTMTDAQAKTLYTSLTNVLTAEQKKALSNGRPGGRGGNWGGRGGDRPDGGRRDRPDGPRGGGDGGRRPGGMGGGRPTEAQMTAMRKMMASSNPLASPRLNAGFSSMPERMQTRMIERFRNSEDFLKQLSQKAR
jgi:hypothetical protein